MPKMKGSKSILPHCSSYLLSSCHPGLRLLVIVTRKCAKQSLFYKKFLDNLFAIPHLHSPITNLVALSNRPSSFRISPWVPKSSLSLSLKLSNLHSETFTKDDFQHQIQIGVQAGHSLYSF